MQTDERDPPLNEPAFVPDNSEYLESIEQQLNSIRNIQLLIQLHQEDILQLTNIEMGEFYQQLDFFFLEAAINNSVDLINQVSD